MEERRQRQRAALEWSFREQAAQSSGDTAGDESITIPPEINPGRGVARNFVDKIFIDRKMAFAKTFFANWIGRRIEKAATRLLRDAKLIETRVCFFDDFHTRS